MECSRTSANATCTGAFQKGARASVAAPFSLPDVFTSSCPVLILLKRGLKMQWSTMWTPSHPLVKETPQKRP